MDTKALEKFCPWARVELIDAVRNRCIAFGLDDAGRSGAPRGSRIVNGTVLTDEQLAQRDNLIALIDELGYDALCEREAYTWFNRFAGIRYMELHGYLPSRVRMLSALDGSFDPECLRAVGELDLPGLDRDRALDLAAAGDDAELFRLILIAQCDQLADALPAVFDHVDDTDALMLPNGLLDRNEHNVLHRLVTDIPEETWDDVEVLGWMYQFYNADLKAEFFKSKRKAAPEDIAPATQLFTPEWIVRYMVDNSLGRLWMLNFPESSLRERAGAERPADRLMEYYIEPDGEHEDFLRISGPEDITFCDPACGSGHILVYAFKMLAAMYEERGYRTREIPELILTRNLSGMEIDERAAQIAQLALAMCAREHDRRFFTRGVRADVRVLESVDIDADSLAPESPLRERSGLLEGLAHLSEIGSLLAPDEDDIAALESALAEGASDTIFASHTSERVKQALGMCRTLARRFDVVVANPPYMGGGSFNPFMSKWMKKHYPDSCKDLCTAFIERGYTLARDNGYAAMVAMQSWMFLGSFEKMRGRIIDEKTILTMAHLGTRAFDAIGGEVVSVTANVLYNSKTATKGAYFRLVDIAGSEPKRQKLLEAIQNPGCGYFYRADATTFHDIPGSPIAYWASKAVHKAFLQGLRLNKIATLKQGMKTADNQRFLRLWFEPSFLLTGCQSVNKADCYDGSPWVPYLKGGDFRKWFGNFDYVLYWKNNGEELKGFSRAVLRNIAYSFKPGISWSVVSSGRLALRITPAGFMFDGAGSEIFGNKVPDEYIMAFLNSSIGTVFASIMSPTLMFEVGQLSNYPLVCSREALEPISQIVLSNIHLSKSDWDSQETSWDFKCNPLIKKEATMRPVLVLVTSQSKKDALINAKAVSGISNLELSPVHFSDGLEHSCAENLIAQQSERYIECYTIDTPDASRNGVLDIMANLKKAFLQSDPGNNPFTSLAFATALLYPTGNTASFLDVITCPHESGKHLGFESDNALRTAVYGAIAQQNAKLSCSELAKNLALLLSK